MNTLSTEDNAINMDASDVVEAPSIAGDINSAQDRADEGNTEDNIIPSTPPPSTPKGQLFSTSYSRPPHVPRYERPINRRLLLQEAQERLSLPDLFSPRTSVQTLSQRRLATRRHTQSYPGPSLKIQPRAVPWRDFCDNLSHSKSQRFSILTDV